MVQCKVLDEYTDKLYDQFVGEGGKLQRKTLQEERSKSKKDAEAAAAVRAQVFLHNLGSLCNSCQIRKGVKEHRLDLPMTWNWSTLS